MLIIHVKLVQIKLNSVRLDKVENDDQTVKKLTEIISEAGETR
jgi:hypothetical protein